MNRKRSTLLIFTLFATLYAIGCTKSRTETELVQNVGFNEEQADIVTPTTIPSEVLLSQEDVVKTQIDQALELIILPNADNIRGNINLVDSIDTADNSFTVYWSSSDENVVTSTVTVAGSKQSAEDGSKQSAAEEDSKPLSEEGSKISEVERKLPAGVVTRGTRDTAVTLTATIESEGVTVKKEFPLMVKAKPKDNDYRAYLYCYFQDDIYGKGQTQQIFLATSTDGLHWKSLNDDRPVLISTLGTKGVRDPYLVRSKEGDKFFIIATDLDANGGDWGAYSTRGSRCIVVWESEDLVNWSEQRLIDIAPRSAECMWAPEAYYDDTTGEYIVYWSSGVKGGNGKKIYYAKTRDFYTFTKPQVFKDVERNADNIKNSGTGKIEANLTFIDTTMIEYKGRFYRFTKREIDASIMMEASDNILGAYSLVKSLIAGEKGVEGPSIFQLIGQEKWVLMMDGYSGKGYFPLIANNFEDLEAGRFVRLAGIEYKMPQGARHGSFLAITTEEYDGLITKWGN